MYLDELPENLRDKIAAFFKNNKILVVSDILIWTLRDINTTMNFFGYGDVYVSKKGSLRIGRITMQRKGGDAGRPTSNMLQFKIKPCDLFNLK